MFCKPCLGQAQMAAWTLAWVPTRGGDGAQHDLGGQVPVFIYLVRILGWNLPAATCLSICPPGPPLPLHMPVWFPACRIAWAPEPEPPESQEQALAKGPIFTGCVGGQWPISGHLGLRSGVMGGWPSCRELTTQLCDLGQVITPLWLQLLVYK